MARFFSLSLIAIFAFIFVRSESEYILNTGHKKLRVCDNQIVRNIPGSFGAVLTAGKQYVESIHNNTLVPIAPFAGAWKWEPFRVLGPKVPECVNLRVFGDERRNYDEAKRFCYFPERKCITYSIGSNNVWDFEVMMRRESECKIETFDCTINATIPPEIRDRTRFHLVCLSEESYVDNNMKFLSLPDLNKLVGNPVGPDYLKMDIEGFEWSVLKGLVNQAHAKYELDIQLPLQIYAEYHLDRDAIDKKYVVHPASTAHVGKKLRHFFDEMFLKGGYMVMHVRTTVQTRNSDVLLAKVFCQLPQDLP